MAGGGAGHTGPAANAHLGEAALSGLCCFRALAMFTMVPDLRAAKARLDDQPVGGELLDERAGERVAVVEAIERQWHDFWDTFPGILSLEAAKEAMLRMGVPEWKAGALNEYAKAHREGYSDFTTDTVEQLAGHPATSYAQFARDFEQRFRGV